jgi:hypothetical protein
MTLGNLVRKCINASKSGANSLFNRHTIIIAAAVVPAYFAYTTSQPDHTPRRNGGFTDLERLGKAWWDVRDNGLYLDKNPEVRPHIDRLLPPYKELDLEDALSRVWKYINFWYSPKFQQADDGLGMKPFSEIVKGVQGSCTEGSFAAYAALSRISDLANGEILKSRIMLITYEKSDRTVAAGHCLYLGEIVKKDKTSEFFVLGINPFENPDVRYNSIEDAIEANTNDLRMYVWPEFLERDTSKERHQRVAVRPQKHLVINPAALGINIIDGKILGIRGDRDPRESLDKYIQRKFMEYFNRNGKQYREPGKNG